MQQLAERVYTVIGGIPAGKVLAYGQVAKLAGYPKHARKVGQLLKTLPSDSTLPWFRVINSQRKISFAENSAKFIQQKSLLEQEGVIFDKANRVRKENFWI